MRKLILALACCGLLASCVKDIDKEIVDVSKTTYLMNGKWQLKAMTWLPDINDPTAFPVDVYTSKGDCEKDNQFVFATSSVMVEYENLKCALTQPDSTIYNYALTQNDRFLSVWSNPDDVANSIFLAGDITFPSIDTFVVTYNGVHPQNQDLVSRYVKTFVKTK